MTRDTTAPNAVSSPANVTTAGGSSHTIPVSYSDANGINVATIGGAAGADVRVTGPNGYDAPASFVNVDNGTNGSPRIGTYSITPPGGAWDFGDNGTYNVVLQSNAVADVAGNVVASGNIGSFSVTICFTDPVVTTNADSGAGSLRQAILDACPNSTITFANGVNLITLTTGQLAVNKNLTFQGPGANLLTISGNNASRVFDSGFGVTVNFNDLTIANGNATSLGAGIQTIYNASTVNLTNCTLTNNMASNSGGGIYSSSNLTLTNCTISNNTATGSGGGINSSVGTLTITDSTITGNSATGGFSRGGGINHASDQAMTITGSTISNNTAPGSGGGISSRHNQRERTASAWRKARCPTACRSTRIRAR